MAAVAAQAGLPGGPVAWMALLQELRRVAETLRDASAARQEASAAAFAVTATGALGYRRDDAGVGEVWSRYLRGFWRMLPAVLGGSSASAWPAPSG